MKLLAYLRSIEARFFHRSQLADDMEEELRSHIELRADDLERSGLSRVDAERQARIEFGGRERFKEESYEALGGNLIESLVQDTRFAFRVLRKSPGFAIPAVVTLALAIGANAVVFSVINAFVVHPLNVPDAKSLYMLERGKDKAGNHSYPDYLDLRDRNRSFDSLAAFDIQAVAIDTGESPSRSWGNVVTGNYFDVLRIQPHLGRFFHAADEHGANSAPYIVLGHSYWQTHFKGDPTVVGRVVQVDKHPFTILGVAPPEFHGTLMFFHPDFFMPLINQEQLYGHSDLNKRGTRWLFQVIGHLKPGISRAQAIADLNAIGADLEKNYPKDDGQMTFALAHPGLYGDYLGPAVQAFLAGLMLLAALILLAACANLGSLFAARAADRSREVALRLAVGAGSMRILRQLFTESVLISLLGGVVGLSGSVVLLRWLSSWQPFPMWPVHVPVNPDVSVYLIALMLALVSGLLFGAAPVRQILRTDPYEVVKAGARSTVERRLTVRDGLLVVQIAICAVLVTSSIVAVRGLMRSLHGDFGFEPEHALLVETDMSMAGYRDDAVPVMQRRMIDAMAAIPSVEAVGLVDAPPLTGVTPGTANVFTDQTTDLRPANAATEVAVFNISPEYLRAARTELLSGRTFTWHDVKDAPRVAIINREFARRIFGSVDKAMGQYYKRKDGTRLQVVGVTTDGKYGSLTEDQQPVMFLPILQSPSNGTFLVVRSNRDPQQLAPLMRSKLRELDAGLPVSIETWNQSMNPIRFGARMAAMALGVLGVMAAMLAITGIFGMSAYSISKRMKELGIRIALGAQRKELLQAALGRPVKLLACGSAAGLLLGILASRVLAVIVYQATPRDPLVLAGTVLAMSLFGLLATWIPAQRALSLDPLILLREE